MLKRTVKCAVFLAFSGLVATSALAEIRVHVSTKSVGFNLARNGAVTCYQTSVRENKAAAAVTNATRQARGLAPLRANADLAEVAARHACDMARRGVMSHRGSTTKGPMQRLKNDGYRPSIAAENIAAGPFTQERVLLEWSRSSGHLHNILLPQVRHYGIGKAIGTDGKTVFWAAVYSAPR